MNRIAQIKLEMEKIFGQALVESSEGELQEGRLERAVKQDMPAPLAKNKRIAKLLAKADRPGAAKRLAKLHKAAQDAADDEKKKKLEKDFDDLVDRLKKSVEKKKDDEKDVSDARKVKSRAVRAKKQPSAAANAPSHAKGAVSAAGSKTHHPFKRRSNLGPGPYNRKHNETKYWKCSCPGGVYSNGCKCVGRNGETKKITIKKDYHQNYNRVYHKWRANQGGAVTARQGGKAHG